MKIVINECFGGFGLSVKAREWLYDNKCPHMKLMSFEEYHKGSKPMYGSYEIDAQKLGQAVRDKSVILGHEGYDGDDLRACPSLVEVVEKLGEEANGMFANLVVVEIPDGTDYEIDEYDGNESIDEKHRTWR